MIKEGWMGFYRWPFRSKSAMRGRGQLERLGHAPAPQCPEERKEPRADRGDGVRPLTVVLIVLLAAAAYVQVLGYQLVWDDVLILSNPKFRTLRSLPEFLQDDFTTLTHGEFNVPYYRPFLALSLAWDAAIWKVRSGPLHFTNILLHGMATVLVLRAAAALGAGGTAAVIAAVLFAIYPVHVEAVAFVSARDNLWVTVWILIALLAHLRARMSSGWRGAWRATSLAAAVMGLLSKEMAVVLPALLLLGDILTLASPDHRPRAGAWREAFVRSLPFWTLALAFAAFRLRAATHVLSSQLQSDGLWGRFPGALESLARYVLLCLVPAHMQPLYDLPRPRTLVAFGPVLGLLVSGALAVFIYYCWRRKPLAAFALAWFVVTIAPVMDLVPISYREMALADRYLYLPSVGICMLFGLGLAAVLEKGSPLRLRTGLAVLMTVVTAYSVSLLRYLPTWRDDLTLYTRIQQVAPRAPNPPYNLGLAYLRLGQLSNARAAMERALALDPQRPRPRAFLGLLNVLQGRPQEGFLMLDAVAAAGAEDHLYYLIRTRAHFFIGEWHEAAAVARQGVNKYPYRAELHEWLGQALDRVGQTTEAVEAYRQALRLDPARALSEEALATALVRLGRRGEAAEHFRRAADLNPERAGPVRALALLALAEGRRTESLLLWHQVLDLASREGMITEAARFIRRLEQSGEPTGSPKNESSFPRGRSSDLLPTDLTIAYGP